MHDTITGERLLDVHPKSGRWARKPGAGSGDHSFNLRDPRWGLPRAIARSLFEPNIRTLVVAWDGAPVYAGVIHSAEYHRATGDVAVRHVDVRVLFSQRLTFGVGGYSDGDLAVTGKSLSGLVRAILKYGVGADGRGGPEWGLPLDLPADTSGSHSLDVKRWEWATIENLLSRVEKLGATIDFDPYYAANGALRYVARVGAPRLPGATSEFVVTASKSPVTSLTYKWDGSKQLSGCFYMGMGSEADMKWGEAGYIEGPRMPVRDAARSAKDVDEVAKLTQMAMHDLVQHRAPSEEWSFGVVIDGAVSPLSLRPGGRVTMISDGDDFVPDGAHELVVTGLSGDLSRLIVPEVVAL